MRRKMALQTFLTVSNASFAITNSSVIWNTNLHRLASRHCFTMFYASEVFAPKCQIDGQPVGVWLRERYNNAYGR